MGHRRICDQSHLDPILWGVRILEIGSCHLYQLKIESLE